MRAIHRQHLQIRPIHPTTTQTSALPLYLENNIINNKAGKNMIRYFDGMGNERTIYVSGLEEKVASLEKENEQLKKQKVKIHASSNSKPK